MQRGLHGGANGHSAKDETPFTPDAAFPNPLRIPGADGLYGVLDVAGAFTISAKPVQQEIVPGKPASLLAYEVEHQGSQFLNPLIRLRSGATIHAKFWNGIKKPASFTGMA